MSLIDVVPGRGTTADEALALAGAVEDASEHPIARAIAAAARARLGSLPGAVGVHVALVEAIRARDADRAERLMHAHVEGFYAEARAALEEDRS